MPAYHTKRRRGRPHRTHRHGEMGTRHWHALCGVYGRTTLPPPWGPIARHDLRQLRRLAEPGARPRLACGRGAGRIGSDPRLAARLGPRLAPSKGRPTAADERFPARGGTARACAGRRRAPPSRTAARRAGAATGRRRDSRGGEHHRPPAASQAATRLSANETDTDSRTAPTAGRARRHGPTRGRTTSAHGTATGGRARSDRSVQRTRAGGDCRRNVGRFARSATASRSRSAAAISGHFVAAFRAGPNLPPTRPHARLGG